MFFTYILLCSDGSYYVGHTHDLASRIQDHNIGKGALYTSTRRPVRLVYSEAHANELAAIERELQIKKWSRAKKIALIEGRKNRLHELSKSRD